MDILTKLCKQTGCVIASTVQQSEDEELWRYERTKGIGGSDIGPIMGISPFTSARQIYLSKTGQFTDNNDRAEVSAAARERMRFGHLLEPVVANEYEYRKQQDMPGLKVYVIKATLCHPEHPWARINVDRIIEYPDGTLGVLECKTTSEYMNDEWDSGDILLTYQYQLQWAFFVTGLSKGAFACLVGGNKFYEYDVFIDTEIINKIFDAARKFWFENVGKLVEPEMQATDTEFVNTTYSEVVKNSEVVFDDDVTNELAETIVECKAKIKELESTMTAAQNRIKDRLQNTEIGYTQDYVIKWSPRSQKRVDSDKLKSEYPEVYEACKKQIDFRVMTIKGSGF